MLYNIIIRKYSKIINYITRCIGYSNYSKKFKNRIICKKNIYLGTYLDKHLKWDYHIHYFVRKLHCLLYKYNFPEKHISTDYLNRLYHALVESLILYCLVGWDSAEGIHINSVEVVQKRILKVIFSKDHMCSSDVPREPNL